MRIIEFICRGYRELFHYDHRTDDIDISKVIAKQDISSKLVSLKTFKPIYLAKGGVSQTLIQNFHRDVLFPTGRYEREYITVDNVDIALDWKTVVRHDSPIIVFFHGIGGHSETNVTKMFTSHFYRMGYTVCVYNRRGHGKTSLVPSQGKIDIKKMLPVYVDHEDIDLILKCITEKYPKSKLFLVGVSCGANMVTHYISKETPLHENIKAAVSISNGYDINMIADNLDDVTSYILCSNIQKVLRSNQKELESYCRQNDIKIDVPRALSVKTITEFDEELLHLLDYKTLKEYYDSHSSSNRIQYAQIPLLCIDNETDPFVTKEVLKIPIEAAQKNSNITSVITKYGGHCSWIESLINPSWAAKLICEYIENI